MKASKSKRGHGKRNAKIGLPPGALVFTGEQKLGDAQVSLLRYNSEKYIKDDRVDFEATLSTEMVTWVDVRGVHDAEVIEAIGRKFDIHPLVLEDIMDVHQRPKFDEYEGGYYITLRNFKFDEKTRTLAPEQISIYAGPNYVFSFQEDAEELFSDVVNRISNGKGKIRHRGADYLVYALLDRVVDGYFLLLDQIGETIEDLEEEILTSVDRLTKSKIHDLKRELLALRRSISPLRDAIGLMIKSDTQSITDNTGLFLRDLYDHCIQVFDLLETSRDNLTSLQDLYISELSFKTNSVMQMLTIVATIFIPLTFLVGVYGMNFDYIPELHYAYSYYILWGVMILLALIMLIYFRRKQWL
ncbi:MAG: magnesium/cobalt transporter CorA [Saprospiraceae bacterium]|nr:magnesium/cobalt transporter CorA [Saprospiraceae bacterium]